MNIFRLGVVAIAITQGTMPAVAGNSVIASYYSSSLSGRKTASGQRYDPHKYTAAHKTLRLGTCVRVSRKKRSVIVVINDRGPYIKGRSIDLSYAAAKAIRLVRAGVGRVRIAVVNCRSRK